LPPARKPWAKCLGQVLGPSIWAKEPSQGLSATLPPAGRLTGRRKAQRLSDSGAPPNMAHFPDAIVQERRRNVAAVRRGLGRRGLLQCDKAGSAQPRQGRPGWRLPWRSTGRILPIEPLTMPIAEDYITPLGAPSPSALARLRSPSLFTR
jgi:hypothetical protein